MRMARLMTVGLIAAALSAGCATVDESKDWVDIKDPDGLRAIFSNKTVKGHMTWGDYFRPYVLHSRADGTGLFDIEGRKIDVTWAINGADQVCFKFPGSSSPCFRYQRHATRANTYRSFNVATRQYGNDMTVTDGLPKS